MKRTLWTILILILAAAPAQAKARVYSEAPDRVGKTTIGVSGGGAFHDDGTDDAPYIQFAAEYGMQRYLALGIEGGWHESGGDRPQEQIGSAHVMADIIVRNPDLHPQIVPYGVLGLGVIGTYVANENDPTDPDLDNNDYSETAFGWKLGGGIDWFFRPNWALNMELAYFESTADLPPSTTVGDDGVSYWTAVGGIKATI